MKLRLLFIAAMGILFTTSCKKDGRNPVLEDNIAAGSYLTLIENTNLNFNTADLSASVGIKVGNVGEVDKINLFVVDDASDDQTWKMIKTIDYTGEGTVVAATGSEIATALGYTADQFLPGTTLSFYNQVVTPDGKIFDINNGGLNINAPDFNSSFKWTVFIVCGFTGGMAGDYKILADGWNDYAAGTVIPGAVEDGPGENQITLHVYPSPDFGTPVDPMIVDIDPATGAATVPPVQYGDYGGGTTPTAAGTGYVFSCTGFITLTLNHYQDDPANTYGTYTLTMQKQ